MQRVSALLPSWDKSKTNGAVAGKTTQAKSWWAERKVALASSSIDTAAANALPRYGRETYWPTSLDRECDKAARILKSFCTDGYLVQEDGARPSHQILQHAPKYVTKNIPARVIQEAVGLAIFSCMRSGLWMSGSGGSGILIARKADGTWSPPSGILLHTTAMGFANGIDIYDCVLVINSVSALELFTRPRLTLGADVNLAVGPLVTTGAPETDIKWKELNNTVLTYLKARGKHQGVDLDGSMVTERSNENERFYASPAGVLEILAGNIPRAVPETKPLFEVIKAAEGRTDFDSGLMLLLSQQPAPGDAVIETPKGSPASPVAALPKSPFGVPDVDDPDPFGVIALEMAGLEIREAGTLRRPGSNQFDFAPAPTSPIYSHFARQSIDVYGNRSNRGSFMSSRSRATTMTDAYTQTDTAENNAETPDSAPSRRNSDDVNVGTSSKPSIAEEPEEVDYTKIDLSSIAHLRHDEPVHEPAAATIVSVEKTEFIVHQGSMTEPTHNDVEKPAQKADEELPLHQDDAQDDLDERDEDADDEDEDEDDDDDEEPIIYEVASAAQPARAAIMSSQVTQVIQARGALVTIPKRIPPPLPARSPARTSRASKSDIGDVSSLRSPLRESFQSADLAAGLEDVAREQQRELEGAHAPSPAPSHDQDRWSIDSTLNMPSTSQATERSASSADEYDHEPHTPRPEDDFQSRGIAIHKAIAGIDSHEDHAEAIAVA